MGGPGVEMIAFHELVFLDIIKQFFLVREDPRNGLVLILQAFKIMSLLFWALRRLNTSLVIRALVVTGLPRSRAEVSCLSIGQHCGRAGPPTTPRKTPQPLTSSPKHLSLFCASAGKQIDVYQNQLSLLFLINNAQDIKLCIGGSNFII